MGTVRSLITRLLAVLAVVAAVVVAAPGAASAGGPTSVLLASPFSGAAAGLYYEDPDYARLQSMLGGSDLPTGVAPPPRAAGSPYVTATWLIHDVYVWRIDRIFLVGGDGGDVWVVSEMSADGAPLTGDGMYPGQTGDAAAIWHRPADPVALTALLTAHGVTPGSAGSAGSATATDPPTGAPLSDASIQPTAGASPSSPTSPGWLWGIGGLIVGLLIGGALVRAVSARRGPTPDGEPARMLPIG